MTFALGCVDAGCVINDLADAGISTICNIIGCDDGQALRDINNWRWCFKRVDLVGIRRLTVLTIETGFIFFIFLSAGFSADVLGRCGHY